MGKEMDEVSKETKVNNKIDSEDVIGVKVIASKDDKDSNKVAADKVEPPALKLNEEATLKSNKQKKKHSSKLDNLSINLIGWNSPKDVQENLLNSETGPLEQPNSLDIEIGSVNNEEAVKGKKSKTESVVTKTVNDGKSLVNKIKFWAARGGVGKGQI